MSFLLINVVTFSFIFWLITFLAKWYYSNIMLLEKLKIYECGFQSLTSISVSYNINFCTILLLLLIYDGEFLILIPFALNTALFSSYNILLLVFFLIWLLIALFIDVIYNSVDWQL